MSWVDADNGTSRSWYEICWAVSVIRLDLSVAGGEYVDFMFQPNHFCNFITPAVGS